MSRLYRKALLERMSSPEQLDKMLKVTSPMFWVALLGGGIMITAALIWSIFGSLPVKVEASGVYVPDQGTYTVASDGNGTVRQLNVEIGDMVEMGEEVLKLSGGVINQAQNMEVRIAQVEAVTLESTNDEVTTDNMELINIKAQLQNVDLDPEQKEAMLESYNDELRSIKSKTAAAKKKMDEALAAYTGAAGSSDPSVEIAYSNAQSEYSRQASYLDSAKSNSLNTKSAYANSLSAVVKTAVSSVEEALAKAKADFEATEDPAVKETLAAQITALETANAELLTITGETDPSSFGQTAKSVLGDTAIANLEQLWLQTEIANDVLAEAQANCDAARDAYEKAKKAYENYVAANSSNSSNKEKLSSEYSKWSAEYNNLYSQQISLEQNILSLESQLDASEIGSEAQRESLEKSFETTKAAILSNLNAQFDEYIDVLISYIAVAPVSGIVTDIKVNLGSAVSVGTELMKIRQINTEDADLIQCYLPISYGKKVKEGMKVIVYPTTVNKQEYGHMQAEVVSVDQYVSTVSSMLNVLGDESLAASFAQSGPVIGVKCRLKKDENTASGYWWSSKKGAEVTIEYGTPVTADIITENKSPISMIIPYIKEKLASVGGGGR